MNVREVQMKAPEADALISLPLNQEFVGIMDVNNDGSISYDEFITTLKSQTGEASVPAPPSQPAPQAKSHVRRNSSLGEVAEHQQQMSMRPQSGTRSRYVWPRCMSAVASQPSAFNNNSS